MTSKKLEERVGEKLCPHRFRSGGYWCRTHEYDCKYINKNVLLKDEEQDYYSCEYWEKIQKK